MAEYLRYAAFALIVSLAVYGLVGWIQSRKRLLARIDETAAARHCPQCGHLVLPWDGKLYQVILLVHVTYAGCGPTLDHQIRLECGTCHHRQEFGVLSNGQLFDPDLLENDRDRRTATSVL
jgi:hypothetical protein